MLTSDGAAVPPRTRRTPCAVISASRANARATRDSRTVRSTCARGRRAGSLRGGRGPGGSGCAARAATWRRSPPKARQGRPCGRTSAGGSSRRWRWSACAGDRNVVRVRLGGVGVKEDALERDAAGGDVPGWRGVLPAGGAKGARASATSGSRVKDMTVLLRTSDVSGMSGMLAGDRGPRDGPAVAGPAVAEVKGSGRSCRPVVLRRLRRGRRPSRSAAAARLAHFDVVQCAQCIRSHGQASAGFGEVSCALEDEDLPTVRTCHYFCLLVAKRPAPPGSCDCRVQP